MNPKYEPYSLSQPNSCNPNPSSNKSLTYTDNPSPKPNLYIGIIGSLYVQLRGGGG